MKTVLARMSVKPEAVDLVLNALPALANGTRTEPGNHAYMAHQCREDPTVFVFYEPFADDAAHEAHKKMPHIRDILDTQEKSGVQDIEVTVWSLIKPD